MFSTRREVGGEIDDFLFHEGEWDWHDASLKWIQKSYFILFYKLVSHLRLQDLLFICIRSYPPQFSSHESSRAVWFLFLSIFPRSGWRILCERRWVECPFSCLICSRIKYRKSCWNLGLGFGVTGGDLKWVAENESPKDVIELRGSPKRGDRSRSPAWFFWWFRWSRSPLTGDPNIFDHQSRVIMVRAGVDILMSNHFFDHSLFEI